VKAFVGHPLGPASGDQLANTLGVFADGIIPGIKTTDKVAEDVFDDHLDIVLQDQEAEMDVAFLNSKGFGGNNATATVLSPKIVDKMLVARYGDDKFSEYVNRRTEVRVKAQEYDDQACNGQLNIIYNFGSGIIEEHEIHVKESALSIDKFTNSVPLDFANPYADMSCE